MTFAPKPPVAVVLNEGRTYSHLAATPPDLAATPPDLGAGALEVSWKSEYVRS